jgi:hypothetical protein
MTANTTRLEKQKSAAPLRKKGLPQSPIDLLNQWCKDLKNWPDSWAGSDRDIQIGASLVEEFKLLLLDRIQKGRARATIKIYAGYLWALGGELIRKINDHESERRLSARQLILNYVSEDGGPYWRHARDDLDHRRYDSVCRQLFKQIATKTQVDPQILL